MSASIRFKRFFLARRTVLFLFSLLLVSIVAGTVFPQRFRTLPVEMVSWQINNPQLAKLSAFLALDHIYTSLWFAIILTLFFLSLLFSSWEQLRLAYQKTFHPSRKSTGKQYVAQSSLAEVHASARKKGYISLRGQGEDLRLVKHPWGYWGNCLLHLGILLVIIASMYIVLTRQKGIVHLAETEVFTPGATWWLEEKGLVAGQFYLTDALQVDSVRPIFWENDTLKQLYASFSFLLSNDQKSSHELMVNNPVHHDGVRINLSRLFGRTFLLAWTENGGREFFLRMDMNHPQKSNIASYKTFEYEEVPFTVNAKYYADAERKNMASDNPELAMRLVKSDEVLAELYLGKDHTGMLGPYEVRLVSVRWWVGLECTNVSGIRFVFLGFFIIVLGVGLTYFMPPREILIQAVKEGCLVNWYPGRFADFYKSELQDIIQSGESSDH